MNSRKMLVFVILLICGLVITACGNGSSTYVKVEPITLEKIDGTDRYSLTLTELAAQRLDIQTSAIGEDSMSETTYLTVPYSTIVYDLKGDVWVYINPSPLTYHREKVTVEMIDGDIVYLSEGPPSGTMVVTSGVAELYGADTGVGK